MFKFNHINRIALVAVMAMSGVLTALAGNKLMLGDGGPISIKPGESKVIAVNLVNDDEISGLQFDMEFTTDKVKIVEGSLKVNDERVDRELHSTTLYHMDNGKWRYAVLTKPTGLNVISGKEGALGYFTIKADEDFTKDDNARIYFSTNSGTDVEANKLAIDAPSYQAVTPLIGNLTLGENAFSIKPGGTHRIDVALNNEIGLYGMQTDIILPEGLQIEKNEKDRFKFTYGDRLSSNFSISSKQNDGYVRVVLSSLPIDKISGNDGVIFSFNVVADQNFVSDENTVIYFTNTLASDENGYVYSLDNEKAVAKVSSMKTANDAAYTRLTTEIAALQKALDDAKAKVAEECKDVAGNYEEAVAAIQTQIDALKTDVEKKNASYDLNEESVLDAETVEAVNNAIANYITSAQDAQKKFEDEKKAYEEKVAANEAAYKRLSEELAAVQARFDEVKETISKDYANVEGQFSGTELSIQLELDKIAKDLQTKYENIELTEESQLDLKLLKDTIEKLLADAKKASETTGINSALMNVDGAECTGIYTLNGAKVENPVKGMSYIFRYANGKTMKVFVK